jgi:hypothetical protein
MREANWQREQDRQKAERKAIRIAAAAQPPGSSKEKTPAK